MPSKRDMMPKRKLIRLREFDYSAPGAYFVTICTNNHASVLGQIANGTMTLTLEGELVDMVLQETEQRFPDMKMDTKVIMPNHIHCIFVIIGEGSPDPQLCSKRSTVGRIVAYSKYVSTKRINGILGTVGRRIWQRNYYEHVIRNDKDLNRAREYIINNPARWVSDEYNLDA